MNAVANKAIKSEFDDVLLSVGAHINRDFDKELPLIQMIGEGSVGPEFATMFSMFINNKLDKLVTPKDILLHDNESYIIGELRNCVGRGDNYRADIATILTRRLINFTLNYAENNSVTKKVTDRLIKLSTDEETLSNDLKFILVRDILNGNKQKFQGMMTNADVLKMAMKISMLSTLLLGLSTAM